MDKTVLSIREDLRQSGDQFVTSIMGYGLYAKTDVSAVLEKAKQVVNEAYELAGVGGEGAPGTSTTLSYAGLEPRDAAILDVFKFGSRTIDEVQRHCITMGFTMERKGQIRSAINATYNARNFFVVSKDDRVSLRPAGIEQAQVIEQKLLKRARIRV